MVCYLVPFLLSLKGYLLLSFSICSATRCLGILLFSSLFCIIRLLGVTISRLDRTYCSLTPISYGSWIISWLYSIRGLSDATLKGEGRSLFPSWLGFQRLSMIYCRLLSLSSICSVGESSIPIPPPKFCPLVRSSPLNLDRLTWSCSIWKV